LPAFTDQSWGGLLNGYDYLDPQVYADVIPDSQSTEPDGFAWYTQPNSVDYLGDDLGYSSNSFSPDNEMEFDMPVDDDNSVYTPLPAELLCYGTVCSASHGIFLLSVYLFEYYNLSYFIGC
jgi:hypothetical protein